MESQWVLSLGLALALGRCAPPTRAADALPPAAGRRVDFRADVKPLFESGCIACHAHGQKKGGLRIDSRSLLVEGGGSGPAARPGSGGESLLVRLVAGLEADRVMPAKGARWTPEQVGLLRAWIDQGMEWEDGVKLGRGVLAPLEPRVVVLPPAARGLTNPVDRLLAPYFVRNGVKLPPPVADRVFARRVHLDLVGMVPTPEELRAFERDGQPDKAAGLVGRLLGDGPRYAAHWLTFWNDALRNDYRGPGFIDGGRRQITPWLYGALATNLPFDRFVAQLVNPDEHAAGFTKGIVWRGTVNASQSPPVQAAQNLSQVFLGINLKCASCHDSFVSDWKLADAYGLAGIYADEPLELVRCDKPTGAIAARKFLFPELGAFADSTNRTERLERLARLFVDPRNGRLTRTIVNRLWARLLGRGLIEPVDEMDNASWNADVLDWLAADLSANGYDLKRTLALIATSRAYRLPAVGGQENPSGTFVFRGPLVKRLSAEQYADALSSLTGLWQPLPANSEIDFGLPDRSAIRPFPAASWIWNSDAARTGAPPGTVYFRRRFTLGEAPLPETALVVAAADNRFTLYVNGHEAGSGDDWNRPRLIDIRPHLTAGTNVLAVAATNGEVKEGDASPNPAGLILAAWIEPAKQGGKQAGAVEASQGGRTDFGTDPFWLCSTQKMDGWQKPDFAAAGWVSATPLGGPGAAPWALEGRLLANWSQGSQFGRVRISLVASNPLLTALGRPGREQVVTSRATVATTLQGLELANGATLAERLQKGAARLIEAKPKTARVLIDRLYAQALGRHPTGAERQLALATVGSPPRREGVEDLLWALSLLPEFQLID
jgi:hypothetical protein